MKNFFVSLHGMSHNLLRVSSYEEYFTLVPNNIEVFTFAPTNYCVYSNEDSEKMIMHFLSNPYWMFSPELRKGGMFEHMQYYPPNSIITNIMLDGDDTSSHFGAYTLGKTSQKLPIVFNASKKETTYDVERLLNTIKSGRVFLFVCSPHTIAPHTNSVLKWRGRNQPKRKATKKYESFAITHEILEKAIAIQEQRIDIDEEARRRFVEYINSLCHRRFTRSMSFPLEKRNGSSDHIPSQIGLGLGETKRKESGIYFKVDKQDQETNNIYEKRYKEIIEEKIETVLWKIRMSATTKKS